MSKPIAPMEALLADRLPNGSGWQYEPKWDGFRCIARRDGSAVKMWSKSGKPLARYFPEVAAMFGGLKAKQFTIDGELVIQLGEEQSFEALQARLHPAESRVRRLAAETPAQFIAFDCLAIGKTSLVDRSLGKRRTALEKMLTKENEPALILSPKTDSRDEATGWLERSGGALDGVIAKRLVDSYQSGERAMVKVKVRRTADCVIGGFRYDRAGADVASLLLGLYDDAGLLNHVGFTSSIAVSDRAAWTRELKCLIGPPGFTGKAPGGPSRWTTERTAEWQPLRPKIIVEVQYDHVTGDHFRHGTKLLRRRPDKTPEQCRMDQLRHPLAPAEIKQLLKS